MSSTSDKDLQIIRQYLSTRESSYSGINRGGVVEDYSVKHIQEALKSIDKSLKDSRIENEHLKAENAQLTKQIISDQSAKGYAQDRLNNATEVLMALASLDLEKEALVTDNEDEYDGLAVGLNMLGQELKASTVSINYLDDIFQSMTEILAVVSKNGIVESINEAGEITFGKSIIGRKISDIIYNKDNTNDQLLTSNGIASIINKDESEQREVVAKDKSGNPLPIDILLSPMKSREGIVLIARDVTERKEAEAKQRKLFSDLEESNKELRQFAYITAHDLKAPLRAISILSHMIQEDSYDTLTSGSKSNLTLLINRTKRMYSFLEGVLSYSEIGLSKKASDTIDLNLIVGEVINSIEVPENIKISLETELPTINATKTHMIQLYQNLISNAIKYMDKTSGIVKIGMEKLGNKNRLFVKDNGMGIEKSNHEKIFVIFQTLVARDTIESTGIGLTIVKKIVEQYGGEISVESTVGNGSCFYFTLD